MDLDKVEKRWRVAQTQNEDTVTVPVFADGCGFRCSVKIFLQHVSARPKICSRRLDDKRRDSLAISEQSSAAATL